MSVEWKKIAEAAATARADMPASASAAFDQALAAVEASGRGCGVDLTDPVQARAAVFAAAFTKEMVSKAPLYPVSAIFVDNQLSSALVTFMSFVPGDVS